jgi:exopolysaccharide biosynthesis protein
VVEIDLTTPGLEVFVTPGEPSMDRDTIGRKTSETVREFDLQLAINGGPYHPYARQAGTPQDIIGLAVSDGTLYSDPEPGYAALLFRKGYSATVSPGPVHDLDAVVQGLGGFGPLLRGGENLGSKGPREPRTAVGIGKDGKLLYLFAADGRQPRWSVGLTTEETADWLRALGAVEAINLDGGGSTTLALRGPRGFVKVVNRPVDYYLIGNERVVANHLGFRAPPVGGEGP